jgi:hypothetical protein
MPLQYKLPGYIGNALLLLLSLAMLFGDNLVVGLLLGALAALNIYLVHKLDRFSREEVWLAHELEMTKMREELLEAQKRIGELEGEAGPGDHKPDGPASTKI